jgi:hypothetical protein
VHHASPLGTRYDIFGSERYVLTWTTARCASIAQYAPYEFIEILVNNETYGGGGIFGQFSTAAAEQRLGQLPVRARIRPSLRRPGRRVLHLAGGLPDRRRAPWSRGSRTRPHCATRPTLKWKKFVKEGTPLPTPWPKQEYETASRAYQKERAALRAAASRNRR